MRHTFGRPLVAGEDPYGVADAFLWSGASSVVGTLWRVESDSTGVFGVAYYQALAGADPRTAIASVAREFLSGQRFLNRGGFVSELSAPRFWAGFNHLVSAWRLCR